MATMDDDGLARLRRVRSLRDEMAAPGPGDPKPETTEEQAAETEEPENALDVLGIGGATIVTYAPEIEEAIGAYKATKRLSMDAQPTEELLDDVEAAIDDLPTQVIDAIADMGAVESGAILAAAEMLGERKLVKDAGRFAAFLFLASRIVEESPEGELSVGGEEMDEGEADGYAEGMGA